MQKGIIVEQLPEARRDAFCIDGFAIFCIFQSLYSGQNGEDIRCRIEDEIGARLLQVLAPGKTG